MNENDLPMHLIAASTGFALLLQSLEFLGWFKNRVRVGELFSESDLLEFYLGIYPSAGLVIRWILSEQGFRLLNWIRAASAVLLMLGVIQPGVLSLILFVSFLMNLRFLGAFNGGSDSMSFILVSGLWVSSLVENTRFSNAGMLWIGVQGILSYCLSGIRKARNPQWWKGEAITQFLENSRVRIAGIRPELMTQKWISLSASWALILFQISYPISTLSKDWCLRYLVIGLLFHLVNFMVFGLNRFFWCWISTYPAIYALAL
jgi:hypothetical protein